ncbi:hypothetical protein VTL71DRAFT_8938 [Oculimacula yallundae]|uniref:Amidohydrolase-related domain-containing protein n=1 Tax=Oculimacula yallundae TaxID=86028 RepID=A0ABR4BUU7_9HELO
MSTTLIHSTRIFSGHSTLTTCGSILFTTSPPHILSIHFSNPYPLPTADVIIDGTNHTVLPGLIDGHVHCHKGIEELEKVIRWGVTTVCDCYSEVENVESVKRSLGSWKEGKGGLRNDVADFRSACLPATVEGGWPEPVIRETVADGEIADKWIARWPKLKTAADAEAFVQLNISRGACFIKLMHESGSIMAHTGPLLTPSISLQKSVVGSAHAHGLITLAHALSLKDTLDVLEAGTDGLAHCFCDEDPTAELLEAYKRNGSFLIPTLIVVATLTGEETKCSEVFVNGDMAKKHLDDEEKTCFCGRMMMGKKECKVEYAYRTVRLLKENGIDIVAGTDTATGLKGTAFGLSLHQELSLYVERCGFTPIEALRSATSVSARRFRMHDRGVLKEGLRADVLMVRGDPTKNIRDTVNVEGVWRGGERLGG